MRCHFGREECLETTLPEARILWAEFDRVDGHRETVDALYDIVGALVGVEPSDRTKPAPRAAPSRPSVNPPTNSGGGAVLIPELQSAIQAMLDKSAALTIGDKVSP